MTSALFSPITMRGLTLPNRIVVSPMCQYASDHGSATDWHLMHLGSFSLGAAGLVMTEMTDVNAIGRITHKCAGMYSDANEAALKRVHDFCRSYGVAKLGVQLAHAGRKASMVPPGGKPLGPTEGAWTAHAPSAIPYDPSWPTPHAMTRCVPARNRPSASLIVRAVSSSRVAWTDCGSTGSASRERSHSSLKRSRPVLFGGSTAK